MKTTKSRKKMYPIDYSFPKSVIHFLGIFIVAAGILFQTIFLGIAISDRYIDLFTLSPLLIIVLGLILIRLSGKKLYQAGRSIVDTFIHLIIPFG